MKIIYSCHGGAHSSVIASAIHVGYLPMDRVPTTKEILDTPHYGQSPRKPGGVITYMGTDEKKRKIYALGMGPYRMELTKLAYNFIFQLTGKSKKDVQIVNVFPLLSFSTKLGGFISKNMGLIRIGRPLSALGIQKRYCFFVKLVEDVKKRC